MLSGVTSQSGYETSRGWAARGGAAGARLLSDGVAEVLAGEGTELPDRAGVPWEAAVEVGYGVAEDIGIELVDEDEALLLLNVLYELRDRGRVPERDELRDVFTATAKAEFARGRLRHYRTAPQPAERLVEHLAEWLGGFEQRVVALEECWADGPPPPPARFTRDVSVDGDPAQGPRS
jgi:hypothetical protein